MQNWYQSVTFLPLACSGAEVNEGVLKSYLGRETDKQAAWIEDGFETISNTLYFPQRKLPTQMSILYKAICPSEESVSAQTGCSNHHIRPDVIVISAGGNEIGFGDIVRHISTGGVPDAENLNTKLEKLPALYGELDAALKRVGPGQVFALAYMDPTQKIVGRRGGRNILQYCSDLEGTSDNKTFVPRFATLLGFGTTKAGTKSAQEKVLQPLNARLTEFAKDKWTVLKLPPEIEQGHGYCNRLAAWFYTYGESGEFQGTIALDFDVGRGGVRIGEVPSGAMHPNIFGHFNMAERIYAEFLRVDLRPK